MVADLGHRIRSVRTHILDAELSEPFAYSRAWYARRGAMIVEIETDSGITGWGEAYGPPRLTAAAVEFLRDAIVGADAGASEAIWHRLYSVWRDHGQKGVLVEAISAIDIALWDIRGKAAGMPIHRLLGGPVRSQVQAYATGLYRRRRDDHERYLREEAASYIAQGFVAVKLKIGFDVEHDVRMTRAVRQEIGDAGLMVDANHAWDAAAASRYARQVEHLNLGWFEEPVPPEDIDGYLQVKRSTSIPIAGGECEYTRLGHRELLRRRAVDVLQPDVCAAGGISECAKIAAMAWAFGVRCLPHVWGSGIGLAASLQLIAVLPHTPLSLEPQEPLLELDQTEHPIRQAILTQPLDAERGVMQIPRGPGLGIEIDRAGLQRFRVGGSA
jgi:D-galactarolactone cycloisomerase